MPDIHILVVDDENEIADLVEIYLVSDGYTVHKASSAEEGLRIIEEEEIHLVLLDIMVPGMDGIQMCKKIRETSNVPIIMLSAKGADLVSELKAVSRNVFTKTKGTEKHGL